MSDVKKILLVDDVKFFLDLEMTFLKRTYCEVLTASNGREALDVVRDNRPDIILLDLYMPEMNGDECCKRLKADPEFKDIPVIMVTMAGKEDEKGRCLLAGCDDYITKPINRMDLLSKIRQYLDVVVRKHLRVPIDVTVECSVDGQKFTAGAGDISEGGMFVESDNPHPVGTIIELEFTMPTESNMTIKVEGEVRRSIEKSKAYPVKVNKGMGIKFLDIDMKSKREIAQYVKQGNYMT